MSLGTQRHDALGTHLHIWWDCPLVWFRDSGNPYYTCFPESSTLIPDPSVALLNLKPANISHRQLKPLLQITTAAKQTIAKAWKSTALILAETQHRIKAMIHAKMEAIRSDKVVKFERLWYPWVARYLPSDFDDSVALVNDYFALSSILLRYESHNAPQRLSSLFS